MGLQSLMFHTWLTWLPKELQDYGSTMAAGLLGLMLLPAAPQLSALAQSVAYLLATSGLFAFGALHDHCLTTPGTEPRRCGSWWPAGRETAGRRQRVLISRWSGADFSNLEVTEPRVVRIGT